MASMNYKQFKMAGNGTYSLKLQGVFSIIIFGAIMIAIAIWMLKLYCIKPDNSLLMVSGACGLFAFVIIRRVGRKFVLNPNEKIIHYSSGYLASVIEIPLEHVEGFITHITSSNSIKVGSALKLEYSKKGKSKEILIGQNVSEKNIRIIAEEFEEIMGK